MFSNAEHSGLSVTHVRYQGCSNTAGWWLGGLVGSYWYHWYWCGRVGLGCPGWWGGQEKSHAIKRYSKIAGNQSIMTQIYLGFFKSMVGVRNTCLCVYFVQLRRELIYLTWVGHLYLSRPHKLWVWLLWWRSLLFARRRSWSYCRLLIKLSQHETSDANAIS